MQVCEVRRQYTNTFLEQQSLQAIRYQGLAALCVHGYHGTIEGQRYQCPFWHARDCFGGPYNYVSTFHSAQRSVVVFLSVQCPVVAQRPPVAFYSVRRPVVVYSIQRPVVVIHSIHCPIVVFHSVQCPVIVFRSV